MVINYYLLYTLIKHFVNNSCYDEDEETICMFAICQSSSLFAAGQVYLGKVRREIMSIITFLYLECEDTLARINRSYDDVPVRLRACLCPHHISSLSDHPCLVFCMC